MRAFKRTFNTPRLKSQIGSIGFRCFCLWLLKQNQNLMLERFGDSTEDCDFMRKYNKWFYITSSIIIIGIILTFTYLYLFQRNFFIKLFGSSLFYRIDRITNFLNQDGYQRNQALASLKASKLFGRGELIYFPDRATAFAFTFLVSRIGIIPSIIFLILYALLIINLQSMKTDKYIITPLITIITFQLIINVLMNIGLFPIIGITLPFLSYGGSSLLSYIILITLALKKVSNDTYL